MKTITGFWLHLNIKTSPMRNMNNQSCSTAPTSAACKSDILLADGLDQKYHSLWLPAIPLSTYRFRNQCAPNGHLQLWKQTLMQVAPGSCKHNKLGWFIHTGHKIWNWMYCSDNASLYQQDDHSVVWDTLELTPLEEHSTVFMPLPQLFLRYPSVP